MGIPEFLKSLKRNRLFCDIHYSEWLHCYIFRFSRKVLDVWRFWEYKMQEECIGIEGVLGALIEAAMEQLSDEAIIAQEREKLKRMLEQEGK